MPLLLGLLLCLIVSVSQPAALEVYLHPSARVTEPLLRLGQVATVLSSEAALKSRLEQLELGAAPQALTLLPAHTIRERIEDQILELGMGRWIGGNPGQAHDRSKRGDRNPGQVYVVGQRVGLIPASIPERELWFYEQLLQYFDRLDGNERQRVEFWIADLPQLAPERPGGIPYQPRPRVIFQIDPPRGTVAGSRWGGDLGEVTVSYRIPGFEEQAGSFIMRTRRFLPAPEAGANLTPRRTWQALPGRRLERDPILRTGDTVTIRFLKPGLRIMVQGKALASGVVGDLVMVQPRDTRERFRGRINSAGEVDVKIP